MPSGSAPAAFTGHRADADIQPSSRIVHSCADLGETTLLVHLRGAIDHFGAEQVAETLALAAATGYTALVLNTSRVAFCDSAFLRLLEGWQREGRLLHLAACSAAVIRLLEASVTTAERTPQSAPADEPSRPAPAGTAV
ncbi:STAS domain-containing protein [Streptomyces sp. A5-4]|uniref:STAS domain-containing protein n=1 Tax=Streptomyces sp. A5-4 TaxID=3384771 RepID=UPI003DA83147